MSIWIHTSHLLFSYLVRTKRDVTASDGSDSGTYIPKMDDLIIMTPKTSKMHTAEENAEKTADEWKRERSTPEAKKLEENKK